MVERLQCLVTTVGDLMLSHREAYALLFGMALGVALGACLEKALHPERGEK